MPVAFIQLAFRHCSRNNEADPCLALEANRVQDVFLPFSMFLLAPRGGQGSYQTIVPVQLAQDIVDSPKPGE